jgi:hypothetical protein
MILQQIQKASFFVVLFVLHFFASRKHYVAETWFEGTPPNLILMEFLGVYEGKSFFHRNFKCINLVL